MNFLPQQINNKNVYVGVWTRLMATGVDYIPLFLFSILYYSILLVNPQLNLAVNIYTFLVYAFLDILYYIYVPIFYIAYGATLGDQAVGIVISRPNGERVLYKRILVLVVGYTLLEYSMVSLISLLPGGYFKYSMLFAWCAVDLILILFTKHKRRLIDFIAGTVYMHKNALATDPVNSDEIIEEDCNWAYLTRKHLKTML